jgi:CheY-like chemotaxis protein
MNPLRLLCVEDDPDIRHIVHVALSLDPAIELQIAESAIDALDMLAHAPVPDAALLDVMMPGIDGPTLLKLLRTEPRTAAMPVIFMTAKARPADVVEYHRHGAIGVIVKPFDPLQLAHRVREVLAGHRLA